MVLLKNKEIRKEIRVIKKDDINFGRFVNAIANLQNSDDWYRICGIHGATFRSNDIKILCPTDPNIIAEVTGTGEVTYCPHSYVTFAAWHTQYLLEFENLLNQYDNSDDKTTRITLPYIDFTIEDDKNSLDFLSTKTIEILLNGNKIIIKNPLSTGPMYTKTIMGERKSNTVRYGFLKPINRSEKNSIANIKRMFDNSLLISTYESFSSNDVSLSKKNNISNHEPIEQPHNECHGNIGGIVGTMSNISHSAFDPIFWLHHCNIDRYFQNWLYLNTNGFTKKLDSTKLLPSSVELTMAPFYSTDNQSKIYKYGWQNNSGFYMKSIESFDVERFEYTYEKIEVSAANNIRMEPKYFELIDIPIPVESTKYSVYIYPKHDKLDDLNKQNYIAGYSCWFGLNRKENNCPRCNISMFNISIEISDYIYSNKITNKNINKYNILIEGEGLIHNKIYDMDEIIKTGKMYLILSWDDILDINNNPVIDSNMMHTKYIQAIINKLSNYGYKIDSNIDHNKLMNIINQFEKNHGSKENKFSEFSTMYKIDKLIKFKNIDLIEEESLTIKLLLEKIKIEKSLLIKYNYNFNNRLIEKINNNLIIWKNVFKEIDIEINFELSENPDLLFEMVNLDGKYSILANTQENDNMVIIRFDKDEEWDKIGENIINLIICHEIGHAFGLNHDNDHTSIMYAFIDEHTDKKIPIEKLKELYLYP